MSTKNKNYFQDIEKLLPKKNAPIKLVLNNPGAFLPREQIINFLSYYEVFKLVKDLPGSIAVVGCFIGNNLFYFSKLLDYFNPNLPDFRCYGFDTFNNYDKKINKKFDLKGINFLKKRRVNFKIDKDLIKQLLKLNNLESPLDRYDRTIIYIGDASKNIKKFKKQEPGVRFKLIEIDTNTFLSTKKSSDQIIDRLIKGGYLLFRGFGNRFWEGESRVVENLIKKKNLKIVKLENKGRYPAVVLRK